MLEHGLTPSTAGGYEIANSVRFNDDDSAYLTRTPSSASNRGLWTFSCWFKRSELGWAVIFCGHKGTGVTGNENRSTINFESDDTLTFRMKEAGDDNYVKVNTSQKFRDASAWYHLVVILDSSQGTTAPSGRIKMYINGDQITAFATYSVSNITSSNNYINYNSLHTIGVREEIPAGVFDGYMAETHFIDGQALDPSNFGETGDYGEWKPIKYTGTYGTNGFYLDFENSGSLGTDQSGNGNNWTPTNLAATDQMLDSPTNNFGTMNPLDSVGTMSEGNLRVVSPGTTPRSNASTIAMHTGKWYAEAYVVSATENKILFGLIDASYDTLSGSTIAHSTSDVVVYFGNNGNKIVDTVNSSYGSTFTAGDIIGIAADLDADTITFYKNNVSQGSISKTFSGYYKFVQTLGQSTGSATGVWNFGQDSSFAGNKTTGSANAADGNGYGDFYYTPPSGYLAPCTANLPDPTVIPSEHFNTVLYTGNGTTGRSITGVGFQPDLCWIKPRSFADNHVWEDVIRGAGNHVYSNNDYAESYWSESISSFDSDGWTMGNWNNINDNAATYAAWLLKAGGSGVSNTDGTMTSTVSANTTAGFSIVKWTGTGVLGDSYGHGLSKAPELIINKELDQASAWICYHKTLGGGKYILLHTDGAEVTNANQWDNKDPTSSVVTVGGSNNSTFDHISYCFHSVDGFSKIGSYTATNTADNVFVYTGFKPAFVMMKSNTGGGTHFDWRIYDNKRNTYNIVDDHLEANQNLAEDGDGRVAAHDFVSNGFKIRSSYAETGSSYDYIYIAFAENPFKHTNAR